MDEIWSRIEVWLGAHAPDVLATLQTGATQAQIRQAEADMGLALPEEVKASYRIHDGQSSDSRFGSPQVLMEERRLLPLSEAVKNWHGWSQLYEEGTIDEADPGWKAKAWGPVKKRWFHPKWVPIATNMGGDFHCTDLSPARGGVPGQIVLTWHEYGDRNVVATGFCEWLGRFADDLEAGVYTYSHERCELVPKRPFGYRYSQDAGWLPMSDYTPPSENCPEFVQTAEELRERYAAGQFNFTGASLPGAQLSRAALSGANLSGADLRGAALDGADLSSAVLTGADLSGANLANVQLMRAGLWGARLREADLTGAQLSEAILAEADLTGARLGGANLFGTVLRRADLQGADLSGAAVFRADLRGASLRDATVDPNGLANALTQGAIMSDGSVCDPS